MKTYIGAKIIQAEPMLHGVFLETKGIFGSHDYRPGYRVVYPDGYVSWSPQATFEEAYRLVSDSEKKLIEEGK